MKKIKIYGNAGEERDEEMEAIGYPPPLNPTAFARKLAEIIRKALQKGFQKAPIERFRNSDSDKANTAS